MHGMRKSHHGTPKRQGGLSLIPALWDRIDEVARAAGVPRNQVIERALMMSFGISDDVHKVTNNGHATSEDDEVVSLP